MSQNENSESEGLPIVTGAKQLPEVPVPSADQLLKKEKLIEFPPIQLLGKEYENLKTAKKYFSRKKVVKDFFVVISEESIFVNKTKQRELAEKGAIVFEDKIQLFCNGNANLARDEINPWKGGKSSNFGRLKNAFLRAGWWYLHEYLPAIFQHEKQFYKNLSDHYLDVSHPNKVEPWIIKWKSDIFPKWSVKKEKIANPPDLPNNSNKINEKAPKSKEEKKNSKNSKKSSKNEEKKDKEFSVEDEQSNVEENEVENQEEVIENFNEEFEGEQDDIVEIQDPSKKRKAEHQPEIQRNQKKQRILEKTVVELDPPSGQKAQISDKKEEPNQAINTSHQDMQKREQQNLVCLLALCSVVLISNLRILHNAANYI